jgi:cytosine/uracil/thiamine/allantoin permease
MTRIHAYSQIQLWVAMGFSLQNHIFARTTRKQGMSLLKIICFTKE